MSGSLVLLSGGLDSAAAFLVQVQEAAADLSRSSTSSRTPIHCLTLDYGQRHRCEVMAAVNIFSVVQSAPSERKLLGVHKIVNIENMLPKTGSIMKSLPVSRYHFSPSPETAAKDPAFVPHRNMMLITLAAMWARWLRVTDVVTGLRGGYPDCTRDFEQRVEEALLAGDPEWPISIRTPTHEPRSQTIAKMMKSDMGRRMAAWSWTCFEGEVVPCGLCLPCHARAEGFRTVGMEDPLLERLRTP